MKIKKSFLFLGLLFIFSCLGIPEGIKPVDDFKIDRYLGRWYEIARFDHPFERGLNNIYAEYSLRNDGGINVVNRGFNERENKWEEAKGKAYFVENRDIGCLKVSFFGPFYSSYIIFELDKENYQYAVVTGSTKKYLWILSRSPHIPEELKNNILDKIRERGFDTDKLIFVKHRAF